MNIYCSFHILAVVSTCCLDAVVNKFTKGLVAGCRKEKETLNNGVLHIHFNIYSLMVFRKCLSKEGDMNLLPYNCMMPTASKVMF